MDRDSVSPFSSIVERGRVRGADYAPPNGKPVPDAAVVQAYGGRIEFIPLVPGRSSTDTIARSR